MSNYLYNFDVEPRCRFRKSVGGWGWSEAEMYPITWKIWRLRGSCPEIP